MPDAETGNRDPFLRGARRNARGRAALRFAEADFLKAALADDLAARAESFERTWRRMLDLGAHDGAAGRRIPADFIVHTDAAPAFARRLPCGVAADEDRLPFAHGVFDLIVSAGALHAVGDLPGALVQARRALHAEGVFLANFVGGSSFAAIRRALIEAELEGGGAAPRLSPMIDPAHAPALLQRAGFADPVVDVDRRLATYRSAAAMIADLRAMGETNILAAREGRPLGRAARRRLLRAVEALRGKDGRIDVPLEIITLTGRGSGSAEGLSR